MIRKHTDLTEINDTYLLEALASVISSDWQLKNQTLGQVSIKTPKHNYTLTFENCVAEMYSWQTNEVVLVAVVDDNQNDFESQLARAIKSLILEID